VVVQLPLCLERYHQVNVATLPSKKRPRRSEAVRKWAHYLHGRTFTLITDQKSVVYMFNTKGKIKNDKIQQWRLELSVFNYNVLHRPGIDNTAPNTFSRVCGSTIVRNSPLNLLKIHETLGHPSVMR